MPITTLTSREFNQDASKAKRAAIAGPVIITDRGRPSHVLLTFAEYKRLSRKRTNIADLLATPKRRDVAFEAPKSTEPARAADLD